MRKEEIWSGSSVCVQTIHSGGRECFEQELFYALYTGRPLLPPKLGAGEGGDPLYCPSLSAPVQQNLSQI